MASVINFMSFDAANRQLVLGLGDQPGLYVEENRNKLIRRVLQAPLEYFLSLDTDIIFEPEVPYALLDKAKEIFPVSGNVILSALYFTFLHNGALKPVWFIKGDHGAVKNIGNFTMGDTVPLQAAGMGCALIHRRVFEAFLKVPEWAKDTWTWFGRDRYGLGDTGHMGEDVCFCQRARSLGFETWGLTTAVVKHAKRFEIGFDEFRILYEANYREIKDTE